MSRPVIAETTLEGLRPVGIGGRRTLDAWDQIVAFLRRDDKLGEACAALFAEPVVDDDGRVEWYAPTSGEPTQAVPAASMAAHTQDALKIRAKTLTDRIQARAEELQLSAREEDKRLGATLKSLLSFPGSQRDNILYAWNGAPVYINWAVIDDMPEPALGVLNELLRVREPPPTQPAQPVQPVEPAPPPPSLPPVFRPVHRVLVDHGMGWWNLLWLLFATLVAAILFLLLWGCAFGLPFRSPFLSYCPTAAYVGEEPAPERAREVELLAEIERLRDRLAGLPSCPHSDPPPPPPVITPEPEHSEFERRRSDAGGEKGAITVTLIWDGDSDLDLAVQCPNGAVINHRQKENCNGKLDIDANNSGSSVMINPIENIRWMEGSAIRGNYVVSVNNYSGRSSKSNPVPFKLRIQIGANANEFTGSAVYGRGFFTVTQFTVE